MQVEEELARFSPKKETALTIGVFDGVHLGHKYLISKLIEQARQQGLTSGVVTFRQHPQEMLQPGVHLPLLTSLDQKTALLKNEGVEVIITLSFTPELASLSARQFVSLLKKYLKMWVLVIGPDFALGHNREGDADALRKLGKEMGFALIIVPPMTMNDEVVSSTAIRNALAAGDMEKVNTLMGHPFSLQGKVVTGASRGGAKLGFPTANMDIDPERALPADGVYATQAYINGKTYQSVTNIGQRPTFDGGKRTVEVYIIDLNKNLYGRELKIDIIRRLRGETRFENAEELKKQIAEDVKQANTILNHNTNG